MSVSRIGRIVAAALGLLIAGSAGPVAAEPEPGLPAGPAAEPRALTGTSLRRLWPGPPCLDSPSRVWVCCCR